MARRMHLVGLVIALTLMIVGTSFADHPDLRHAPNPLIAGNSTTLFFSSATSFTAGTAVTFNGQVMPTTSIDSTALAVDLPGASIISGQNNFQITEPGSGNTTGTITGGTITTPADFLTALQLSASELRSFVLASVEQRLAHDSTVDFAAVGANDFVQVVRQTREDSTHFGQELRRMTDRELMDLQLKYERFLTDYFQSHRDQMTPAQFQHLRLEGQTAILTARRAIDGVVIDFVRILPDVEHDLLNSETKHDCTLSIEVIGRDPHSNVGPDGTVFRGTAGVTFKIKGHIDPDCVPGNIMFKARIRASYADDQGHERRAVIQEKEAGRVAAQPAPDYLTALESVEFDRREALDNLGRFAPRGFTFENSSTQLEIAATVVDKCGCVAETVYRARFPEFFNYHQVEDPQTHRMSYVPWVRPDAENDIANFSDANHSVGPCHIELSAVGVLTAIEPTRQGDNLPPNDVVGALVINVAIDPGCHPGGVEILRESPLGSLEYLVVQIDGKDVPLQINATVDPDSWVVNGVLTAGASVRFPAGDVAAAVARAVGNGGAGQTTHAYATMRGKLTVHAFDDCGCEVAITFTFGPKH